MGAHISENRLLLYVYYRVILELPLMQVDDVRTHAIQKVLRV